MRRSWIREGVFGLPADLGEGAGQQCRENVACQLTLDAPFIDQPYLELVGRVTIGREPNGNCRADEPVRLAGYVNGDAVPSLLIP